MKMSEVHKATKKLPPEWSEGQISVEHYKLIIRHQGSEMLYDPDKEIWRRA